MNAKKTRPSLNGSISSEARALVQGLSDWCTREEFCLTLKRERNRSNRTGLPISYVNLRMDATQAGGGSITRDEFHGFLADLLDVVTQYTRDFDVRCLQNDSEVGILLVDTPLDGAKAFIEKLTRLLYRHFQAKGHGEYIRIIQSVTISSYPVENIAECSTVSGKSLLDDDKDHYKGNGQSSANNTRSAFVDSRESVQMQWDVNLMPDGSIALELPIFSDLLQRQELQGLDRLMKRALDIIGGVFGLLLFFPAMLVISAVVKLTSRGPVLFKQQRLGQYGRPFTFLKFRSMRADTDDSLHKEYIKNMIEGNDSVNHGTVDKPVFKLTRDPRITPIGSILRKTSLDEIPQFINVIMGTMSLVGPRPSVYYEVENYKNWHLRRVLEAKPGITGLWQVYGRSKTTFDDMVRLDLKYVENQSIWLDLKILLRTIPAILNVGSSGAM